jgi:hypothetical protein
MTGQDAVGDFVPIRGELEQVSQLGVFLIVQSRRIFVEASYMQQRPDQALWPGEAVTLNVSRNFARREGLVA